MTQNLRFGLLGLGRMGRHHARVLSGLDGVDFVGGYDPAGDRFSCLGDGRLFTSQHELLASDLDAVIVATHTSQHAPVANALAEQGLHALIEKPVALTSEEAYAVADRFRRVGLLAAVGHIERFNPAIGAMRDLLSEGKIGRVVAITTTRVGPNTGHGTGCGVALDLATHDVDLIRYLSGSEFAATSAEIIWSDTAQTDDLITAVGRLRSGIVYSLSANRLTPTKTRQVSVLGEDGVLQADTITADLTHFREPAMSSTWDAMAHVRGPYEGEIVRLAVSKHEPLRAELEGFRDAVAGLEVGHVVSLEEGAMAVEVVESMLRAARVPTR